MIYAASIRRLGVIKIGHTLYPRDRICSLRRQYGQKVRYIALAEGSMNQERILHESLWQHCIGAELYPSGVAAIRRAVAAIRAKTDVEAMRQVNKKTRPWKSTRQRQVASPDHQVHH